MYSFTKRFEQVEHPLLERPSGRGAVCAFNAGSAGSARQGWDTAFYVVQPQNYKIHSHKCPSRMIIEEWGP